MKNEQLKKIISLKAEKNYKEAIKLANVCFKKYKDNCFYNEAYDCLFRLQDYKGCIKILKKMLKTEPQNIELHRKVASSYFRLNKYKDSLKYYKKALALDPLSHINNYNVASLYHYLKDFKNAIFYYNLALRLKPEDIYALNNAGCAYYENKDYETAKNCYRYAMTYSPSHPEAYHHMGVLRRDVENDFEMAIVYLKKAIMLDPYYPDNFYELGLTYFRSNKTAEAIGAIENCLKMESGHKRALKLLNLIKK